MVECTFKDGACKGASRYKKLGKTDTREQCVVRVMKREPLANAACWGKLGILGTAVTTKKKCYAYYGAESVKEYPWHNPQKGRWESCILKG